MAKFKKNSKPKPTPEQMLIKFVADVKKECLHRNMEDQLIEKVVGLARESWRDVEVQTKTKIAEMTANLPDASKKVAMGRAGKISEGVRRKIAKKIPDFVDECLERIADSEQVVTEE